MTSKKEYTITLKLLEYTSYDSFTEWTASVDFNGSGYVAYGDSPQSAMANLAVYWALHEKTDET